MSPDTLAQADFALFYTPPSPDEAGNPYDNLAYAAVPGSDEIIVLSLSKAQSSATGGFELLATGYGLGGQYGVQFQTVLADLNNATVPGGVFAPCIVALANGTVAIAWQVALTNGAGDARDAYAVLSPSGESLAGGPVFNGRVGGALLNYQGPPDLYAAATGFNIELNAHSAGPNPLVFDYVAQSFDLAGTPGVWQATGANGPVGFVPHAFAAAPPVSLQLADNTVQVYHGAIFAGGATLPGEPEHAITREAAAMLAGGRAAVAWVDSGTAYVSVFDPSTVTFSARTGLDWGGVQDVHLAALPDGGFVASWTNTLPPFGSPQDMPPRYEGRVFAADGLGGPVMNLSGDVAGIDNLGDLYTVASFSNGVYIVTYAIGSAGGPPLLSITGPAPANEGASGVTDFAFDVTRTGDLSASAMVDYYRAYGGTADSSDFSGPTAGTVYFQAGQATGVIHIGVNGDAEAESNETFTIALSNARGGVVDVAAGSAGATIVDDDSASPGGSSSVSTSDPDYRAPAGVTTITLTGASSQTVHGDNEGDAFWSNNNANRLYGGSGDDTFHLGRNGDVATGGGGNDTFAFAENPWAPNGRITDFNAGDVIDLTQTLHRAGFSSGDPVGEGYVRFANDASGNAQVLFDPAPTGGGAWWLVTGLDGVDAAALHANAGLITM